MSLFYTIQTKIDKYGNRFFYLINKNRLILLIIFGPFLFPFLNEDLNAVDRLGLIKNTHKKVIN